MTTLKLHYDGWLALPAGLREKLGLKSGDRLEAELIGGTLVLRPAATARGRAGPGSKASAPPAAVPAPSPVEAATPGKRKPGRPRKVQPAEAGADSVSGLPEDGPPAKRKPGRPRKVRLAEEPGPAAAPASEAGEPWKLRRKTELPAARRRRACRGACSPSRAGRVRHGLRARGAPPVPPGRGQEARRAGARAQPAAAEGPGLARGRPRPPIAPLPARGWSLPARLGPGQGLHPEAPPRPWRRAKDLVFPGPICFPVILARGLGSGRIGTGRQPCRERPDPRRGVPSAGRASTMPKACATGQAAWLRRARMRIKVGYELEYDCPQPTPMILTLNIHYSRVSDLLAARPPDHQPGGPGHRRTATGSATGAPGSWRPRASCALSATRW